jgi:hypothetical protein
MLRPPPATSAASDTLPMSTSALDPTCRAKRAETGGGIDAASRSEVDTSRHQSLLILRIVERDVICGPLRYEFGRGAKRGNRQSPGFMGFAAL